MDKSNGMRHDEGLGDVVGARRARPRAGLQAAVALLRHPLLVFRLDSRDAVVDQRDRSFPV